MEKTFIRDGIKVVRFEIDGFGHYEDSDRILTWIRDIYLRFDDNGNFIKVDANMKLNDEEKEMFYEEIMSVVNKYLRYEEYETYEDED